MAAAMKYFLDALAKSVSHSWPLEVLCFKARPVHPGKQAHNRTKHHPSHRMLLFHQGKLMITGISLELQLNDELDEYKSLKFTNNLFFIYFIKATPRIIYAPLSTPFCTRWCWQNINTCIICRVLRKIFNLKCHYTFKLYPNLRVCKEFSF